MSADTTVDSSFTLAANKYAGACWYCTRRVRKGEGVTWPSPDLGGKYAVGHTDCVTAAVADGHAARVMGSHQAPTHARALRQVRDIMRTVRMDADAHELVDALERVRAIVDAVPRAVRDPGEDDADLPF